MKSKQVLNERRQLMKIAGLLKEEASLTSSNNLSPEFKESFRTFIDDLLKHMNGLHKQGDLDNAPMSDWLTYMNNASEDQSNYFPDEEDEGLFQEIWDTIITKAIKDDAEKIVTIDDLNNYFRKVQQMYGGPSDSLKENEGSFQEN